MLIIGLFAPVATMPIGSDPSASISLLGSTPAPQRYHQYPHELGIDVPKVLAIAGGVILLYAALAILMTSWWSSARHLLFPSLVIDAGLIGGMVSLIAIATDSSSLASLGWGWGPLIAGNVMIIVAAIKDRRAYAAHTTTRPL